MRRKTAIIEQIESIPAMMRELIPLVRTRAKEIAAQTDRAKFRRVILTGCGDSYAAALAAKQIFMEYTSLWCDVVPVIDLSRHYPGAQFDGTLTVIVSNSGNVSRVIELARRIRHLGGTAIAVTNNEHSDLCKTAGLSLLLGTPKFHRSGPGLRAYCACLVGIIELGLALGEETEEIYRGIDSLPDSIEAALPGWQIAAQHLAEGLKACTALEFIGAGPEYGTAFFALAKELEIAALPGAAINTEDWLHMNYFVRSADKTAAVIFTSGLSPDKSRADEVIETAAEMGRPLLVVTDHDRDGGLKTPKQQIAALNVLTQYLPISLVIAALGEQRGETDFRGTADRWTACIGFATIADSQQTILD